MCHCPAVNLHMHSDAEKQILVKYFNILLRFTNETGHQNSGWCFGVYDCCDLNIPLFPSMAPCAWCQ
jgi:hypothetical protein